jgi:hypothetical protein
MGWGEPQQGAREMLPRVVPLTLLLRYDRVSAGLTDKRFPTSLSRPVRWENECLFRRGDRNRNGRAAVRRDFRGPGHGAAQRRAPQLSRRRTAPARAMAIRVTANARRGSRALSR